MRKFFTLCFLSLPLLAAAQQDYFIKFPDDGYWDPCPPDSVGFGKPVMYHPTGGNMTASYEDEIYTIVPDACYAVERNWYVYSDPYDPQQPCIQVPNPNPSAVVSNPVNFPGPIVSAPGTPAPWTSTVVKLYPTEPDSTDFSQYWVSTANCYHYKQKIKVLDPYAPVIPDCVTNLPLQVDSTLNDGYLWNEPYWLDPLTNNHNLSEMPVDLSIEAWDQCAKDNVYIRYLLFLDLDNNGVMETVINSNAGSPPTPGLLRFNNANTPNFMGGTLRAFDSRPVPANQKNRFGYQYEKNGPNRRARMMWYTGTSPNLNWTLPQLPAGTHKIKWFVEDGCGNETVCEYTFSIVFSGQNLQLLKGEIVQDQNADCLLSAGEPALKGWRAKLESLGTGGATEYTQYLLPNTGSHYAFYADTGQYRLSVTPPNAYWGDCPADHVFSINTIGDSTLHPFAFQVKEQCPFLETEIGIWGLRRCFDNTYTVRYCNTGPVAASNAWVEVTLDPFLSFVGAGKPATNLGNHRWRFDLGALPPGECGFFPLTVHLACDGTVIGQTHCVEAHIFPDSICSSPPWNGANVEVDGACHPDSVRFYLRNTGAAPTSLLDYIVIEDNIINYQGSFQLPPGDSMLVSVPANGSTWRLEAQQEPGNPGNPLPSATVEACGQNAQGQFSVGYVSQFGEDDQDPFVSQDCQESRGSYDPNDKQGFPLGYGDDHLILPGQPLEYLIRFQNTGTDTAFQVVIRDTLQPGFDPLSVAPGTASHPFRFDLSGEGVLTFYFENILLPDSNVNEPASHGFVKFRVAQRPGLPLGTALTNRAGIYFDFNLPVLTPETRHVLAKDFLPDRSSTGQQEVAVLPVWRLWPNPATGTSVLRFSGTRPAEGFCEFYDLQGGFRFRRAVSGGRIVLNASEAPAGVYFFKVFERGQYAGAGRVVLR